MTNILLFSKPKERASSGGLERFAEAESLLLAGAARGFVPTFDLYGSLYDFAQAQCLYEEAASVSLFVINTDHFFESARLFSALRGDEWNGRYRQTPLVLLSEQKPRGWMKNDAQTKVVIAGPQSEKGTEATFVDAVFSFLGQAATASSVTPSCESPPFGVQGIVNERGLFTEKRGNERAALWRPLAFPWRKRLVFRVEK